MFRTDKYNVIDDLLDRYYYNYEELCTRLKFGAMDDAYMSELERSLETPNHEPTTKEEKIAIKNKAKVRKRYEKVKKLFAEIKESEQESEENEGSQDESYEMERLVEQVTDTVPVYIDPFLSLTSYSPRTEKEYELVQTLMGRYHRGFDERFKAASEIGCRSAEISDKLMESYRSGLLKRKVECRELDPELFQDLISRIQKI